MMVIQICTRNFNQLKNYMQFLLSSQVGLNKLKVLQFNRIDFRLSWFKFNFPNALIINLRRKSRDVYASYIGVYERLNKKTYEPRRLFTFSTDLHPILISNTRETERQREFI